MRIEPSGVSFGIIRSGRIANRFVPETKAVNGTGVHRCRLGQSGGCGCIFSLYND